MLALSCYQELDDAQKMPGSHVDGGRPLSSGPGKRAEERTAPQQHKKLMQALLLLLLSAPMCMCYVCPAAVSQAQGQVPHAP
jgi:hypothetical protein